MTRSLTDLQQQIQSDNWQQAVAAADATAEYGAAALPVLLPLLKSDSERIRDAAALALRTIADNASVEPLVQAIQNPATTTHRGTLVYALETHDCSHHFLWLFRLALDDTYEVQHHALTILTEQQFWYDLGDLETAQIHLDATHMYSAKSAQ